MNNEIQNGEVLFESNYTRTPELVKEIYAELYLRRPIRIVFYIFFLVSFVFGVVSLALGKVDINSILLVFLPLFVVALTAFNYVKSCKLTVKRDLEQNGGEYAKGTISITENGIAHISVAGINSVIDISAVKSAKRTKNCVYLITESKLVYVMQKEFTKGSPEELFAFLKSKNIKCK